MSDSRKKRFRLGYSGCLTDLIVLALLAGLGLWGIHRWNHMAHRPLGLPAVPLPGAVRSAPASARRWLARVPVVGSRFRSEPTRAAATPPPPTSPAPRAVEMPPVPVEPEATPALSPEEVAPSASPASPASPAPPVAVAATVTTLTARVRTSTDPLSAPAATALRAYGGGGNKLALGLPDGSIALWDRAAKAGTVVAPPAAAGTPSGSARAIAVGADGTVWWLGAANRVYAYQQKGRKLHALDLPPGLMASPPTDLAVLPDGIIALLGDAQACFLDAATGRVREPADVLPPEAAEMIVRPQTSLFVACDTHSNRASLLVVSGDGVTPGQPAVLALWTTPAARRRDAWTRRMLDTEGEVPAFSALRLHDVGRAAIALTPDGFTLLTRPNGGQTLAAGRMWTSAAGLQGTGGPADAAPISLHTYGTLPEGVFGLWAPPERVALGRSGLWWVFGGVVLHAALPGGATEVYLPWNGAGTERVAALLADDTGAWVATDKGVRRITPGKPSDKDGYGGYVRARLGPDAGRVPTVAAGQKLDRLTHEWQGTPYVWGGDTKKGVDCSGYVRALYQELGVSLPRATRDLATCETGRRVRDELHYGDVLIFPGHCAVYIGNGWTSEAMVEKGVRRAAVWSRKSVIIRRFAKL